MVVLAMAMAQMGAAAALAGFAPPPVPPPADEDLVFYEVVLDGATLTDALTAYEASDDPLLPLGELSRLLDLDVSVFPAEGRASGSLGEASRSLVVDATLGLARAGGADTPLPPGAVAVTETDIYLRAAVLERLLPLRIAVDPEFLQIALTATETLPIQAQAARAARLRELETGAGPGEDALRIDTPYRMISAPAFDVALETGYDTRTELTARRYDVRAAADVLGAGSSFYLGSDVRGEPANARVLLERRWVTDGGAGRGVEAAAGDVFTPLMTLGPRSGGGRGASVSVGALGAASAFQRITLRGELPLGYDVELYVNDVLRSGQRTPVEGRYEFIDVPLSRGLNVLRIVTYGPHGERSEETQVLNVGGGLVERGDLAFEIGAVQQDRPVIELERGEISGFGPAHGELRLAANAAYGLSDGLTLVGGGAAWTDTAGAGHDMLTAGLRGSLGGVALLGDAAHDFGGGSALAVGAAGELLGISYTLRHLEYSGGFPDEANSVLGLSRPPRRRSEANLNFDLRRLIGAGVPLSLRAERTQFEDGGAAVAGFARTSAVLGGTLASAGLDYARDRTPGGETLETLAGDVSASRYIDFAWRTRAVLDFVLMPEARLGSFGLTADRDLSDDFGIGLGAGRIFGRQSDVNLQANAYWRLGFGDVTIGGDYAARHEDWRIGMRLAFGMTLAGGPRLTRPGPATGGSALLHAFIDRDGDGMFGDGEEGAAGVTVTGGEADVTTGADGRAFVTGLGDAAEATLRADTGGAELFYVSTPPQAIIVSPRPGVTAAIPYPLAPAGEVYARLYLRRPDGTEIGLSAVRLRLTRAGAGAVQANTEFDGTAVFAEVRPGTYALELDPDQAARLSMRLAAPVGVTVREDGYAPDVSAEIVFAP